MTKNKKQYKNLKIDETTLRQIREVGRQMSIDGQWFKKQIWLILLIAFGVIFYITNRYQAQQEIILHEQLRSDLQDWKFRSLTRNSELTLRTRQSQIEKALKQFGDSTLKVSIVPTFQTTIKTNNK